MKKIWLLLFGLLFTLTASAKLAFEVVNAGLDNQYVAICYHDVRDDVAKRFDDDQYATSTDELIRQFEWFAENGYHPVSVQQIIDASNGGDKLPEKAILLTFDDGYVSLYEKILPILTTYQYPAVFALVTNWIGMSPEEAKQIKYNLGHDDFLTWAQVREIAQSPLIEIASHSHDLHQGHFANPQGNDRPRATSAYYDKYTGTYESEEEYAERIRNDLSTSVQLIKKHTGKAPRVMVWPYGANTAVGNDIAQELGMEFTFTVDNGLNDAGDRNQIKRFLLTENIDLDIFAYHINNQFRKKLPETKILSLDKPEEYGSPKRVMHVDLDLLYDANPTQQEANLSKLIDRVYNMKVSTVYLQAFADPDADGVASALYFPNSYLPMRSDLFNRASWQLRTRAGVEVYAWMPIMAFDLADSTLNSSLELRPSDPGTYHRLDITKNRAREIIKDIYNDLAFHADFTGVIFHDDGFFTEDELTSLSISEKTALITDFTLELMDVVKKYRTTAKSARNIYAEVVLNPGSERWFAQNFEDVIANYDYAAVMAMPLMEGAANPTAWLENLATQAKNRTDKLYKVLFELQAVDWRTSPFTPVSDSVLGAQMELLRNNGIYNYGYYPDNTFTDQPSLNNIKPEISVANTPYLK